MLDASNTRTHRVGSAGPGRMDAGRFVGAELQIEDASVIARVDSGELAEISAGYQVEYDATPGVWEGQPYDGVQRKITLNHVALLPVGAGRAGPEVGLRLDSADACALADADSPALPYTHMSTKKIKVRMDGAEVEIEVSEQAAAVIEGYRASLATAEKALAKAETAATDAQKRLDAAIDPKALDARVTERVALETSARQVLGAEYSASGKTSRQVHEDVVRKARPEAKFDGRSDDFLCGLFEAAVESAPDAQGQDKSRRDAAAVVLSQKVPPVSGARTDATDDENDPDAAYRAGVQAKGSAWKGTSK